MNVSPHHQRPTKYPWPGPPSAVGVVVVIVAALILGFIVMTWVNDDDELDATGSQRTASVLVTVPPGR